MFSLACIKYGLLIDVIQSYCTDMSVCLRQQYNSIGLINNSSGNYGRLIKFIITLAYGKTNYCVYACACMCEMKCLLT